MVVVFKECASPAQQTVTIFTGRQMTDRLADLKKGGTSPDEIGIEIKDEKGKTCVLFSFKELPLVINVFGSVFFN